MAGKRNKVSVGLIKGNLKNSNETKPDVELFNEKVKKGEKREKVVEPVLLISRLNYPVEVKLGEDAIRISPRSKLKIADASKLGALPNGVVKKRLEGKN